MRIRTLFTLPLMFTALFTALPGCGQTKQAAPAQGPAEVTVVTITPHPVTLTTVLAGRTSAHLMSDVRPQVGGIIQKRLFKEGSEVKAGELLYQIDPASYQASYDSAKASLAQAVAVAQPAKLKAERYANLVKVNGVSKQDNDDAQATYLQDQASVLTAKASLETARINLAYTRVTSPIAGRIGKSSVTPGALVTASQSTALATVQQINPIYVDVTQSSAEVIRLKRDFAEGKLQKAGANGAKVKLLYEDGSPYGLEGVLQFSDITVDQSTGVITLRAQFPNPKGDLLPGLYVRAVLEEGVDAKGILVPQVAVSRDSKGQAQVMVVKADGVVEQRNIIVSRVIGDKWLVSSGLAAGDKVIVEGLQKVKPGGKAKPIEAAEAQPEQTNATAQPAAAPAAAVAAAPAAEPQKAMAPAKEAVKTTPTPKTKPEAVKPQAKEAQPEKKQVEKKQTEKKQTEKTPSATATPGSEKTAATKNERAAYSPPKDHPWPTSTLSDAPGEKSEQTADHKSVQQ